MFVSSVKLNNFRNYKSAYVQFKQGLNLIVGKNAQGKTNLLEAIYYTSIGKSPRVNRDADLIFWESEQAKIDLTVQKKEGSKTVEVFLNKKSKKSIKINQINLLKIGDLLGCVSCVYFSPDELKLVKDTPEDRRNFMDTDISQLSKNYFYLLIRYNKILSQRNKLLKDFEKPEVVLQTLPVWDTQLAKIGAKIIIRRIRFLNKVKIYANQYLNYLTDNKENLIVEYEGIFGEDEESIESELLKRFNQSRQKDMKLGFSTVGPHRDDIALSVNGIDVKTYGSQGQQRTVALSLKLAELEIFKEEFNESPILLLDDVLSELDDNRQKKLLEISKKVQTILTTTNFDLTKDKTANVVMVENGKILK